MSFPTTRADKVSMAFVTQQNHLFNEFTVRETLAFASQLKNGSGNFGHASRVTKILNDFALEECEWQLDLRNNWIY